MTQRSRSDRCAWWAVPPLLLQCFALNASALLTWPTWALVFCSALKLRECRRPFDRRLVALLQLLSVGLLAAQLQGLLATVLQVLAVVLALAGLLGHELAGSVSFRGLMQRSLQLLGAALPLALVLFLFLPRVPPLWISQLGPTRGAVTGLSPDLDPLSIVTLSQVNASAARMTVAEGVALPTHSYWRVLVHEQFDGRRWQHTDPPRRPRGVRPVSRQARTRQWWVVEPSATRAVPWDGVSRPGAPDQWITPEGELVVGGASRQKRSFRVVDSRDAGAWQQQPPSARELQLPAEGLVRLRELGAGFRALPNDQSRVEAAERWFRSQPFRYSLQPGKTTDLDAFLFDRQLGFCGHYASAFAALMRSAAVPARVVSGYRGGYVIQPLGGPPYLELRQSDAHAWVEVWLEGLGWQPVDPTQWIQQRSSALAPLVQPAGGGPAFEVPWWQWLQRQWWGLDLAWTRWWLGFDQTSQQVWLERLFGHQQRWLGLVVVLLSLAALALGLCLLRLRLASRDPLQQSLRVLARLGVMPQLGESFPQLCSRAAKVHPAQAPLLMAIAQQQQLLAHAPLNASQRRDHWRQWRELLRQLKTGE